MLRVEWRIIRPFERAELNRCGASGFNCSLSAVIFGLAALFAASEAAAQTISITDDRGKPVTLARAAQRIVTLAPSLSELAFAAGAGERLVGVARFSDFPPAARGIPAVGDAAQVDFERIVGLKPDLVLAWKSGNSPGDVSRLERLGYPAFVSEPARLADIPRALRAIGLLAGTQAVAEKAAAGFEREIGALRARHAKGSAVRVFYQIWHQPLQTVNSMHIINDVISLCGGENVFAGVSQLTPVVSLEAVIEARPEVVIGGGSAGGAPGLHAQWRASPVRRLRELPVHYINPDHIHRQTPRIVEGARAVCTALEQVRMNRQDAKKNKNNN